MNNITVFRKNKKIKVLFHFPESLSLTIQEYQNLNSNLLKIVIKVKKNQR